MSVQEMAMRNSRNLNITDPAGRHILDADCLYENGKFILTSLPRNLPSLCTVRFTAPADYAQGDVVVVKGKELPVRTPGMVNASTGLYKAGAVMHCDIDMDREIAFFWQGAGTGGGVLPNLSYDEQFAGYYDLDGKKVYVKTIEIELFKGTSSAPTKTYPHAIPSVERIVEFKPRWRNFSNNVTNHANYVYYMADQENIYVRIKERDDSGIKALVTLYYTCTDR